MRISVAAWIQNDSDNWMQAQSLRIFSAISYYLFTNCHMIKTVQILNELTRKFVSAFSLILIKDVREILSTKWENQIWGGGGASKATCNKVVDRVYSVLFVKMLGCIKAIPYLPFWSFQIGNNVLFCGEHLTSI